MRSLNAAFQVGGNGSVGVLVGDGDGFPVTVGSRLATGSISTLLTKLTHTWFLVTG
jgi:hypothetical protein